MGNKNIGIKLLLKIVLAITFFISLFIVVPTFSDENLNIGGAGGKGSQSNNLLTNFFGGNDFGVGASGEIGIYNLLIRIARDAKNLFFFVATIYFLIIVYKLLASDKSEEELGNFKKGIIWISIGIAVMQISYSFVRLLFDRGVSEQLAFNLVDKMILPIVKVLETGASFFFIGVAIYAFYRLITANGNEEAVKSGKTTVFYSIVGFIIVKFSRTLVEAIYGKLNCVPLTTTSFFSKVGTNCIERPKVEGFSGIITTIINWANGFIGLIILLMIIYAGYNILFSGGDEEMLKKAKSTILYVAVGLFLLITNYIILTFFIFPTNTI